MAFYDSGLRIVRHISFVETEVEFATLHCVRLSPELGGMSATITVEHRAEFEMCLYGFGRYFHQNRVSATIFISVSRLRVSHSLELSPVRNDQLYNADKYFSPPTL